VRTCSRRALVTLAAVASLGLAACQSDGKVSTSVSKGSSASEIDAKVTAALNELYKTREGSRTLANQAKAILVFPDITQAGLGVGGAYGTGAMRRGGSTTGYYNLAAATVGFQIGAQSFSQAYFFNTQEALNKFEETKGFELGAGATAVAADFGASGEVSTSTLQQPLVVVTWGQSGLMAGVSLEGAKISQITP
jgi:lipid-binding SYLF domain-containing protein